VHKAINLSSGAAVAVKLIGKDRLRRPHERASIEKEIETMRVAVEQFENGHPHIVRLLCTKESQQHIYIVLVSQPTVNLDAERRLMTYLAVFKEYCAGGDLAAVMKASRGLSEADARVYLSQLGTSIALELMRCSASLC
jgi:serine/threonine protein kinase